jgi:flagellar biosynthesis/type III secretory pathway M-ring protein FliF/YscJ
VIAWWLWTLIWVGLVFALLLVLVLLAFRLFRKAMTLMDELSAVADKTRTLDVDGAELSAPQNAILAEMSKVRAQHEAQKRRHSDLKLARHERRIARAKRITARDASSRTQWPEGWS